MNLCSRSLQDHHLQRLNPMLTEQASEGNHGRDSAGHAVSPRGKAGATFRHTPMVSTAR